MKLPHPISFTVGLSVLLTAATQAADEKLAFNRDVRAILSDKCFACHGPDENTREAKLRLDTQEGGHAEAIVPGKPEESELLHRLLTDDPDEIMPPPETNKTITPEEREILRRWIAEGAEYQDHWAFIPPTRPDAPEVADASWPRNSIDHFTLKQLESRDMKPSREADKRTLIRRVTLDLTGLPPTPAEVEAFIADTSADAFENVVDRLLASERYGEHMSRYWLDAVRYGDTHGLHLDNYREFYPYRDWIIEAFNSNKPYDAFVIEQLAGDLLPDPTIDQLVATGFNRAHVTTAEGGSIKEEVYVRNVVDRVSATGTIMMGLTTGCAVCHDHKFDPLTQREFFQMFGYFNNLDADPMDGNKKDHAPVIKVPTREAKSKIEELQKQKEQKEALIAQTIANYDYKEPKGTSAAEKAVEEFVWIDDKVPSGVNEQGGWTWVNKKDGKPVFSGERASYRKASGMGQHFFDSAKDPITLGKDSVLFAHVWLDPKNPPKEIMLQINTGQWQHRAYWGANSIDFGKDNSTERRHMGALPKSGEWVRLQVKASDVGLKEGSKISGWAFTQFDGEVYWDKAGITNGFTGYRSFRKWIADQRMSPAAGVPGEIIAILKKDAAKLTDAEKTQVRRHYLATADLGARETLKPLRDEIASIDGQISATQNSFPTTLVWRERTKNRRDAYILNRGEYDQRGEMVKPGLPAFLPPLPEGTSNDRLGFAKWLLEPSHPLTSRVTVNRFWQQVFGVGIVKTAEDFGSQGEWPSHPGLLDWLAVDFRENGWDVKRLMRQIVTSATYRQTSEATPARYADDPENRLLARGPRFRLDAESLRDQALFVSGLLVEKIGGPGVKPPQPDGLWFTVGYSGSNTVRFKKDSGAEKVHRRSIYTFWKRTSPPPQMIDAPSRESCAVRRERTNTPLQALMFMNDPQYVEAARAFAERWIELDDKAITDTLFAHALGRAPDAEERAVVFQSYTDQRAYYQSHPDEAKALIAIGETPSKHANPIRLAAWTMAASLVINLDEFVTKN